MLRIDTYKHVNTVLGSSLTPDDRCIDKTTAINNGAETAPLEQFEYNRLIPVEYISAGSVPITYYTIQYIVDGNVYQTYNVASGDPTPVPQQNPTKSGHMFTGWTPTIAQTVTANATYTAQFIENSPTTVTLTFISDGSNYGNYTGAYTIGNTFPTVTPNPTKSGYRFTGWSPVFPATVPNVDTTYTAQFEQVVTLTFMSDGAQYHQDVYVVGNTLVSPGTPTKTGDDAADYIFGGWEDDNGNAMPATVPSTNTTYYAKWVDRYTKLTDFYHGIHDRAEEGEAVVETTRTFTVWPCTEAQSLATATTTGAKTVTLYITNIKKYVNIENDSYNKTYTLDTNPTSCTDGVITLQNWGYTATNSAGELGHSGGRWTITFSSELEALGWAVEDYFDDGGARVRRTVNQDGSVSYLRKSNNGTAMDDDAADMLDARYDQKMEICVNKNDSGVDPGVYYTFDVKIDPKYTAEKHPISGTSNTLAGLTGISRNLYINLASL